jgi:glycosyltransferase involved in cell wall biosynthesis
MNPLVSIGIPCYNSARWLAQAIESALSQTWPEKEVIVVDDGSTDNSAEVARSFGDRIQFFQTENRGGNHARNLAVQHARGEWLQFLDADDYLEPAKVERQLNEVSPADADVIYSPIVIETGVGAEARREIAPLDTSVDLYAQWLAWEIPQTGGALWRKSALDAIGGWKDNQPCCQEHELYLRALQAELRFVFAPSALAIYRIWSESTVCRKDPRLVIRVKTGLIDELRAWLSERGQWTPVHQRVAGRACFEMARTWAKYDRAAAAEYHRERRARQLIHLEGPAAPLSYQVVYRTLGFSSAERLAAASR